MLVVRVLALVFLCGCGARTELDVPDACAAREITLQVPAQSPWTDTGIDVTAGESIVVDATGTVRYGGQSDQVTDANGGNFDGQKLFSTAVLPNAIVVSLIGKIGGSSAVDTGAPLPGGGFVGTHASHVAPASGRLFLGFNDQRQAFDDNGGAFTVTLRLGC